MKTKNLGLKDMKIMPIANPDACPICGTEHDPTLPHNRDSLYYQYSFFKKNGRYPTWDDATAHCPPEIKSAWMAGLKEILAERDKKNAD